MTADDLAKILDELGQRLGPTGAHVFDLAVRQVFIDALTGGFISIVLLALGAWTWRRAPGADHYDGPIIRVVGGLLLFASAVCLVLSVTPILNPEYSAIKDILGAIRR